MRVQASEKLKRQGFGRCTWTPHRHALGTTMNKRQESRKKNKPERGRPTELHRAVHPNTERENKNGHCTMRSPGEGSWQGRAAHANDGQVKVKVHEGHQVNIKLPETKWKQRPGFPSQHSTAEWHTLPRVQCVYYLCLGQSKLPPQETDSKNMTPGQTFAHRDWDHERQDRGHKGFTGGLTFETFLAL